MNQFIGVNKIGSQISTTSDYASHDFDPIKQIIYTAFNWDDKIFIYQLNSRNGESINSRYHTDSVCNIPYATLFLDEMVYVLLSCSPDNYISKQPKSQIYSDAWPQKRRI